MRIHQNNFQLTAGRLRPRLACFAAAIVFIPALALAEAPSSGPSAISYSRQIRSLLASKCFACHGPDAKAREAGLRLDVRNEALKELESGERAIVPSDASASELLRRINSSDEDEQMPPSDSNKTLSVEEKSLLRTWIVQGAPYDEHWAFLATKRTEPPAVADEAWNKLPIDRFIRARLDAAKLRPAPLADQETLIRRATFALTGLPPTPEQIDKFNQESISISHSAFRNLIDRLLASQHFGERWARHWLDVARYAESSGGGRTLLFPNAWRYRDYVIRAFNEDRPFDLFIREQIAGDLLPHDSDKQRYDRIVATGFLVLGPTNYENQNKEQLRMDVVDEQIDTIGRAFLGLTIGCARCHDHKFDPISTKEYYGMAGILRSTKTLTPGNVSGWIERDLPADGQLAKALASYQASYAKLKSQLDDAKTKRHSLGGAATDSVAADALPGVVVDDIAANVKGNWQKSSSNKGFVGAGYVHDQNAEKGNKSVTFSHALPPGEYEVRMSYTDGTNRATKVPVIVKSSDGEQTSIINQRKRPPIDGRFISLGKFKFAAGQPAEVVVSNKGTSDGHVIADAVQFLEMDSAIAATQEKIAKVDNKKELTALDVSIKKLETHLKALEKTRPKGAPKAMSVLEEANTGDFNVCVRGDVHSLGERAPRGFVRVASSDASPAKINAGESGRSELANWIASPVNPLTARVYVNRVWQHLIGEGLVRTPDNFGYVGELPSHPELLDWLATRFVTEGWSTKKLIREIMLSRTYQLGSARSEEAKRIDPENRLLSHAHRRRLDAESLRDAMLLASGKLDLKVGGQTMKSGTNSELGYNFATGPSSTRRSIYVPVFRNTLDELFEVFDFADPNIVIGRRNSSTLATQALFLMNSPFATDHARDAAQSVLAMPDLDDAARIELAYRRALGRMPTDTEKQLALRYVGEPEADADDARLAVWSAFQQTLFACIDFRYVK
jgi:hypothetical protein